MCVCVLYMFMWVFMQVRVCMDA
uniref:Uncharacterized protein n=1 Tax=Anguilla anguilla TaxID=7936 RepID=A0A0E9QYT3_ANGAN